MNTYSPLESLDLLALLVCGQKGEPNIRLSVEVATSSGKSISYNDLELVSRCGEVVQPRGLNLPQAIKFVARGVNGLGPFAFIWPAAFVDPDQAACKGLGVERVQLFSKAPPV